MCCDVAARYSARTQTQTQPEDDRCSQRNSCGHAERHDLMLAHYYLHGRNGHRLCEHAIALNSVDRSGVQPMIVEQYQIGCY